MKNNKLWTYLITLAVGLILMGAIALSRKIFNQESTDAFLTVLCDSLFVPGVLITGLGLIIVVASEGAFDMLGYGFKNFFSLFTPRKVKKEGREKYYDYVMRKKEMRENNRRSPWPILIIGITFLLLAGSCFLYYLF